MIELAEVFRRFAADYLSIHGASTYYRADSTRSATRAYGILHNATTPPECGRCCNCGHRPSPTHHRSLSSRHMSPPAPRQRCRSNHGSARTAITDS